MTHGPHLDAGTLRGCLSEPPIVGGRVELQLITTLKCNLRCSYCSLGVGDVIGSQTKIEYTLDQLEAFVETHFGGKEVYVTFYGGEPTLNLDFMREVMRRFPWFRYQLQTNGTRLGAVDGWILERLSNVLVSVDGGEETTDQFRGKGTYARVRRSVDEVRHKLGGTLTARVTWSSPKTTAAELEELVSGPGAFDFLYWQFATADVYSPSATAVRRQELTRLVDRFFSRADTLFPLVPLMGIVRNQLFPERAKEATAGLAQCRVSTHLVNVMPSGAIFPCPDLMYVPALQTGEVQGNWLRRSPLQPTAAMPCGTCEAKAWCRGNCIKDLHLAYEGRDEVLRRGVVEPVCELLRFLGKQIEERRPRDWYGRALPKVRRQITDAEIYEYVEIMP